MQKNVLKNKKVAIFVSETITDATNKIISEIEKLGAKVFVFYQNDIFYTLNGIFYNGIPLRLEKFSFGIFRTSPFFSNKHKAKFDFSNEINVLLKNAGKCKILNDIAYKNHPFYNKFTQMDIFSRYNISSIQSFHNSINETKNILEQMKKEKIKFPCIAKISNSSQGSGVFKIKSKNELESFLDKNRNKNIIFQKFIYNDGDYRVIVVGNKSLGIMKRMAGPGQWKNNISLAAKSTKFLDKNMERIALNVCKKIGLDFAGVDILKDGNKYCILEVNDIPGFSGFEKIYSGVNVSKEVAEYLLKSK